MHAVYMQYLSPHSDIVTWIRSANGRMGKGTKLACSVAHSSSGKSETVGWGVLPFPSWRNVPLIHHRPRVKQLSGPNPIIASLFILRNASSLLAQTPLCCAVEFSSALPFHPRLSELSAHCGDSRLLCAEIISSFAPSQPQAFELYRSYTALIARALGASCIYCLSHSVSPPSGLPACDRLLACVFPAEHVD